MRPFAAVVVAALCLVLLGCADASRDTPAADGPPVTFRGTAAAESMAPAIRAGDRIIATQVPASGPESGDIVVYEDPGDWLGTDGTGQLVHRVIATAGDELVCCGPDGRISVNGTPLDEPYLAPGPTPCNAEIFRGATEPGTPLNGPCDWRIGPVPDGMLFVMGDNRGAAADSRFHLCPPAREPCGSGPWVPVDLVRGVVKLPSMNSEQPATAQAVLQGSTSAHR